MSSKIKCFVVYDDGEGSNKEFYIKPSLEKDLKKIVKKSNMSFVNCYKVDELPQVYDNLEAACINELFVDLEGNSV